MYKTKSATKILVLKTLMYFLRLNLASCFEEKKLTIYWCKTMPNLGIMSSTINGQKIVEITQTLSNVIILHACFFEQKIKNVNYKYYRKTWKHFKFFTHE